MVGQNKVVYRKYRILQKARRNIFSKNKFMLLLTGPLKLWEFQYTQYANAPEYCL